MTESFTSSNTVPRDLQLQRTARCRTVHLVKMIDIASCISALTFFHDGANVQAARRVHHCFRFCRREGLCCRIHTCFEYYHSRPGPADREQTQWGILPAGCSGYFQWSVFEEGCSFLVADTVCRSITCRISIWSALDC